MATGRRYHSQHQIRLRNVCGPPGVTVGVMVAVDVAVGVLVLGGTVAGSGVESSAEMLAQPVSRLRKIARVRNRRIILNQSVH